MFNYTNILTSTTTPVTILSDVDKLKTANSGGPVSFLWQFSNSYRPVHGWLSTGVCLFGIPSNLLNIIVLTRPHMISSPTNLILTGLAFSDLFTMLSSLVFSFYFYVLHGNMPVHEPSPQRDTKIWTHFAKIHVMASVTFHSLSIWLTVYLAIFRYIYLISASPTTFGKSSTTNKSVSKSNIFQRFLTKSSTYIGVVYGILFICLFCIIFCFPAYLYPTVRERLLILSTNSSTDSNYLFYSNKSNLEYVYYVAQSDLDISSNGLIFKIMFYLQAIFGKFLPCLLLVTFSSLLIHSLVIINRNNKKLNKSSNFSPSTTTLNKNNTANNLIPIGKKPKDKCSSLLTSLINIKNNENKINSTSTKNNIKNEEPLNEIVLFDNEDDELIGMEDSNENNNKPKTKKDPLPIKKQPMIIVTTPHIKAAKRNKVKENLRTTLMLILVCILFLLTEFPQAILMFFSIVMGNTFYENVYMPLGDFMDIIALVNNAINFLLYCIMSRQFRETCVKLLSSLCCFKTNNNNNNKNNNNNMRNNNYIDKNMNHNNKRVKNSPAHQVKDFELKNFENGA